MNLLGQPSQLALRAPSQINRRHAGFEISQKRLA
jgi:hypothetical protein